MIHLILINIIILLILHYIGTNFFSLRFRKYYIQLLVFLIYLVIMTLVNINGITTIYIPVFLILIYYLYLETQFLSRSFINILTALLLSISMSISEFISGSILNYFPMLSYEQYYTYALYLTIILTIILILPYKVIVKPLMVFQQNNFFLLIFILPFFSYILVVFINQYLFGYFNETGVVIFFLFTIIGILASNYIMIYFYMKLLNSFKLEFELHLKDEENRILSEKISALNQYYQSKFDFLHDLLHSICIMTKLLKTHNYTNLEQFLDNLANDTCHELNILYSNSNTLNLVLLQNLTELKKYNVDVRSTVIDDFTFLDEQTQIKLYTILLNLYFEILGKEHINNPSISFYLKKIGTNSILKVYLKCTYSSYRSSEFYLSEKIINDLDLQLTVNTKFYSNNGLMCVLIYECFN